MTSAVLLKVLPAECDEVFGLGERSFGAARPRPWICSYCEPQMFASSRRSLEDRGSDKHEFIWKHTCIVFTLKHTHTFVTHDCELHSSLLQDSQTFSLLTVLHVTEIKTGHKDPEAKVGRSAEELSQFNGTLGTGRPGAEPGDGVTGPFFSSYSVTPQTRTQGSQVTQKQHLWRNTEVKMSRDMTWATVRPIEHSPRRGSPHDCAGVQSQRSWSLDPPASLPRSTGRSRVFPLPNGHFCNEKWTFSVAKVH